MTRIKRFCARRAHEDPAFIAQFFFASRDGRHDEIIILPSPISSVRVTFFKICG
jgi:hypothetical protein